MKTKNIIHYIILVVALMMTFPFSVSAQEAVKKKVAVYMTGDDVDSGIKKVIGARLVSAITQTSNYAAVERTADFLKALTQETDYQQSGEVRDNQIAALGKKFGVKYVVVADVSEVFDEYFIAARLINVETGLVEKAYDETGQAESASQLVSLANKIASGLLSGISAGGGRNSISSGGNVERFTVNGVTFEMVKVDGGSYQMGSYNGDSDEQPVHTVNVSTFYIGKTEVTQALWAAVMGNNPSYFRGENLPVENVSWHDCQEFVDRLSRLTGRMFRLPTENEWEYAARGGNRSRGYLYSGSDDIFRVAWYTENSGGTTHPVAQKSDNELGIFDMSGNVWEWTSDLWSSNYSSPRNGGDSGSYRVFRGGGWGSNASYCRVANRGHSIPSLRNSDLGLRLAL